MKTRKNWFCINDKESGSVWGKITTFEALDGMAKANTLGEVKFIRILNEWNGKRYIFMRDDGDSVNYFVEM